MKIIITLLFFTFFLTETSEAQKFTFVNINSSIADITSSTSNHFSLGIGKVIYETPSYIHSVGLRAMYYKRPNFMDGGGITNVAGVFLLSDSVTRSFHVSYQIKRKLFKNLSLFVNLESGLLKNTEEFRYSAKDHTTNELLYTDEWKDNYSLNMSYSFDLGFEYFIVKNESYFISTSIALQRLNSVGDLEHNNREGEFNKYEFDTIVVEPEYLDEFSTNYFWLAGVNFGFNIW